MDFKFVLEVTVLKSKRIFKSVISFILILTICVCATLTVNADPDTNGVSDYSKRATAMINFFHNKNSGIEANDISAEEFRVFGVFLSNFVLPFNTDLKNIDATLKKGGSLEQDHNAWDLFCDAFGKGSVKDKEPLSTLLHCYKSVMNDVFDNIDDKYKLYYKKDGEYKVATWGEVLNWDSLANDGVYLCSKIGGDYKVVFDTATEVGKSAFMLSVGSVMGTDGLSDSDTELKDAILLVSPFGDICYKKGEELRVLVPACLNPYTFSDKGDKLYLNNSFATGGMVSSSDLLDLVEAKKESEKADYYLGKYYEYCNDTTGVMSFVKGGTYSSAFYTPLYVNGANNSSTKYGVTFRNNYYVSGWTINDLRQLYLKSNGTKIAVVNIDSGLKKSVSQEDLEKAKKYKRGILNEFYAKNTDFVSRIIDAKPYDSYLTIFSNIWASGDAGSAKWWNTFGTNGDTAKYNSLTVFQIPLEQTVSKFAVFSEDGFKGNGDGWDESELSVVKDSKLYADTTSLESSLSEMYDPHTKSYVVQKNTGNGAIHESISCITSTVGKIFKASKKYVKNSNPIASSTNFWAGIYWAYLEDLAGLKLDGADISFGSVPDFSRFPELTVKDFTGSLEYILSNNGSETETDGDMSEKQNSIINWTYDILNTDSVNNATRVNWLKSIVDGLFLSMHNSMVGVDIAGSVTSVGNAAGSGVYHSVMGYVTTPTFSEMPVTNWVMDNYTLIYLLLMLIVTVILVVMVMSRTRRIGSAVFTFVMMSLILILPVELLNGGILFSNKIAEDIFGSKFTYWAIVQHAQYVNGQNEIVENGDKSTADTAIDNIANTQAALDNVTASQQLSDNGITVKWLSPKKYGLTEKIQQQAQDENTKLQLFTFFTEELFKGEIYSADENSTFLYRTYYSLYTSASSGHKKITQASIKNASGSTATEKDIGSVIRTSWIGASNSVASNLKWNKEQKSNFNSKDVPLTNELLKIKSPVVSDRVTPDGNGMILRSILGGTWKTSSGKSVSYPSGYVDNYIDEELMSATRNTYVNTNRISAVLTDLSLNKAVLNFVNYDTNSKGLDLGTTVTNSSLDNEKAYNAKKVSNGVNEFLLYTESPYYYFYNVFSDVITSEGSIRGSNNFVKVLLDEDFFKVANEKSNAYGEFKDFLDLEGLFTYIIPYLNYANSDVKQFERTFGMTVDRASFTGKNAEANYNARCQALNNVWNLYSPWVDALYDANNGSQKARSGFDTVSIDDPLNPASYHYKSRPMAFSQAQAKLRGYAENDLTDVEKKLQSVLKNTYDDMVELLNYKDLVNMENGSDILISAAAMMATFNFNQEFSDNTLLSDGATLYPLSFEMRNMNYDSFLRLIIANSTYTLSSSTMSSEGLYSNLIHNTSVVTAILLILVDAVAVYILPALKILLMLAMLALGLAMSISCALNKPDKLAKTVCISFIIPLICTIGVFILHTLLISLFMGNGVTGVIEYKSLSLSTGDPTITLLLLLIIDAVTALLLYKLLKKVGKDLIKYTKTAFEFAKGVTLGAAGALTAGAVGTIKGIAHYGVGVPARHIAAKVSRHKDAKANAKANARMNGGSGNGSSGGSGKGSSGSNNSSKNASSPKNQTNQGNSQGKGSNQGKNGGTNSQNNSGSASSNKNNGAKRVKVKVNAQKVQSNKTNNGNRKLDNSKVMSGNKNYDNKKPKSRRVLLDRAGNTNSKDGSQTPKVHRSNKRKVYKPSENSANGGSNRKNGK